ncbi:type II toxin-antitoxin system PemK/MazF family toxin [Chamaesiphon polymorphus]|uniref:Transcriptional regulator n=1 Tax=Chamaesiphon polymorphus CCALA 037 TaxID=2107692 RepID=A0A2T1GF42_9CYAN|nr:type II toxin-antitoxin system PemK/MazF family toxin [Chamaesiphon polymorphus]PSB56102.1 transcriptional regulator [Chamaesiphon polymorphus CCALA 037]
MNPQPGEVWLADLGLAAKTRPVIIVSRYDPDPPRVLVIYVPLTTQYRESLYEVVLPKLRFLDRDSIANVQGIGSIPTVRLERMLGKVPDRTMLKIKQAIVFALDLNLEIQEETEN